MTHESTNPIDTLLLAVFLATFMAMGRNVNVAELKDAVSELIDAAAQGEEITICRRNVPVARLTSLPGHKNRTKLGFATNVVVRDIAGPAIPEDDWDMLTGAGEQGIGK